MFDKMNSIFFHKILTQKTVLNLSIFLNILFSSDPCFFHMKNA